MALTKYTIKESTLKGLADAIREVNGETRTYTPEEMIEAVTTIMDSITYILVDKSGDEVPAIYVENETVFTAGENDIRAGKVAAIGSGVVTGTKDIPSYNTQEGYKLVPNGMKFTLPSPHYDYTKLQAIFCPFNTSVLDSVAAEKVAIENHVYPVKSSDYEASIVIDTDNTRVDFGITNDSGSLYLIRYILYKEIY